jgi:hypothetical protein
LLRGFRTVLSGARLDPASIRLLRETR